MNCWEVYKIGELCDVITGSTPSRTNSEYWNEGSVPWFTVDDIRKGGRVIHNTIQHVTEKAVKESSLRLMPADTVLLCCTASVGEYAITRVPITSNQQFNGLVIKSEFKDKLSADFLFNVASTLKEKLKAFCGKTSVDFVSGSNLKSIQVPLPPLAEQRKIAEILRTWDEAIETAEAELKAKQQRKRWLMDKLFGPALVDRHQGWRRVQLGHCFSERSENGHPGLTLLSITGDHGVVDRELIGRRDTSAPDKGKYRRICPGDIGYNTMRMWQGVCGLSGSEGIVSPAYTILRPLPGTNAAFMYYLFKCPAMIAKFHSRSQGLVKDTLNLKFPAFSKIYVNQPDLNVQKDIVSVLEKTDAELSLSGKYIEALRAQKRGLMQKLMTGEVRVAA